MSESLNDIVSRIVLEHQLADEKKIEEALELQREILSTDGRKESLERVLVDMGVLKGKQLKGLRYAILYYLVRKVDRFYGKIAVQSKLVSSADVDKALKEQKRAHNKERRLVRINKLLMEAGVLKKAEDKAITKAIEELRGNRKKRKKAGKGETPRSTAKTTIIKRTERFDDDDDAIEMLKSNLDDDELELDGISEDELESLDEVSDIDEVPTLDDDEFDDLELDEGLDDDLELADDEDKPKAKASQGSEGELDEADDLDDVDLDSADLDLDDSDDAVDELESFEDELDEEEASNAVTREDELESFEDDLDDDLEDDESDEAPAEEASEAKEARRVSNKLAKASGSKRQKAESAEDKGSEDELDDLELDDEGSDESDDKAADDSGSKDEVDSGSGDEDDSGSDDGEDDDADKAGDDDAKGKTSASGKLSLKERLAARKKSGGKDEKKKKKGTGKFDALRKKAPKPRKKKW